MELIAGTDDGTDVPRTTLRRGSFRFGVLYARTGTYHPFATIGLASDGGVFISPANVPGSSWSHGPLISGLDANGLPTTLTTPERPKLHYHRSGIVRATLSGHDIQAETSRFSALHGRGVNTFMSVVATRPDAFPAATFRNGDDATIEGDWPTLVSLSLAVVPPSARKASFEETAPAGLVLETPCQAVVDLAGYGHSMLLLSQTSSGYSDLLPDAMPSVTVAAYEEPVGGTTEPAAVHGLWSSSARNPVLGYVDEFLWESDRHSDDYYGSYARRFNRLPPWHPASGTPSERTIVEEIRRTPRPPDESISLF